MVEDIAKQIRETFADTLDKGASFSAIIIHYQNDGKTITEIGVPYEISGEFLEIGPYFKNILISNRPNDYFERKHKISIKNIKGFKRIELSDIL